MRRRLSRSILVALMMATLGTRAVGDTSETQPAPTTSPLVRAASEGDLDDVTYLVGRGTNVNAPDNGGNVPLTAAIAARHADVEQYLLTNGADPNAVGPAGRPLEAALLGHPINPKTLDLLNRLLAHNAELNFETHGAKELFLCAVLDDAAGGQNAKDDVDNLMVLLMQHGAVGAGTKIPGCDVLGKVVTNRYMSTLRYMLGHGTDVNAPLESGGTLLDVAISAGDLDFVKLLLASGADINAADPGGVTPLQRSLLQTNSSSSQVTQHLLSHGAHADTASQNKLLEQSLSAGNFAQAAALLSTVSDVSTVQVGGQPLLSAILDSGGHYDPLLQSLGAGQGDALAHADQNGVMLAKSAACLSYDLPLLQFLVAHGDTNLSVSRRAWVLVALVNCHHMDAISFMLAHGYDLNVVSGTANTPDSPLCAAADSGAADEVGFLLQHGADVNRPDSAGNPPLLCAIDSARPRLAVVQSLVDHGADFNVSIGGMTPLARALKAGATGENEEIAGYLKSVGASTE